MGQGRHCSDGDNLLEMVLDVFDEISGNTARTENVCRPQKEMTLEQIDHARLVWTSTQYATNEEAIEQNHITFMGGIIKASRVFEKHKRDITIFCWEQAVQGKKHQKFEFGSTE
ncbi:hypothetical protein ABVF61_00355 [Roseibium sp. HPY-6]|uniref:hypothetical protein n=1 Tax=Roseibium sp. HPY-6 TaxID=3229852 RepID=UPI00338D3A2A